MFENELNAVANDSSMVGFGSSTVAEIENLNKALSISQSYGTNAPNTLNGGSALAVEDLDRTLKIVTFSLQHLRMWKDIKKEKTTQVVSQYNVQNSYGQEVSPFFQMGGNPTQTDANYQRDFVQVKYLGTQGQVEHNLTLIQAAHGPVVAREVKNKTVELLGRNERAMFDADSAINALEYDGIEAQIVKKEQLATYKSSAFAGYDVDGISDSVIIDARQAFSDDLAETMSLTNVNNFGMAMDCYMGTDVHSKFSKDWFNKQRTLPGAELSSGNRVKNHQGTTDFAYKPSLFNRVRRVPLASAVSGSATPTKVLAAAAAPDSQFDAGSAGTYSYRVSLVYADGETLASTAASQAVTAGQGVNITLTYAGAPLYANVFRSAVGSTSGHQFIGRVALAGSTVAIVAADVNANIPGGQKAFLVEHSEETLMWRQLGSLIKYDLAVTNTSYRWLQLMYGTPIVASPRKAIIAKNLIA